jgi:hypothetical protein
MPMPSEITALIERLNQELDKIEREATEGLNLTKVILESFPNNFTVIQLSAFLNTAVFFVDISKRRIQTLVEHLSVSNVATEKEIQEAGEDLATDLGRALETKMRVSQVKTRLAKLQ